MREEDPHGFQNLADFGITYRCEDGKVKINTNLFREKLSLEADGLSMSGATAFGAF